MTKDGLSEAVSNALGLNKKQGHEAVETVFDTIVKTLARGEEVAVSGFGSFRVTKRAARTGVNPRTGERIQIPASVPPKFPPPKIFKKTIK